MKAIPRRRPVAFATLFTLLQATLVLAAWAILPDLQRQNLAILGDATNLLLVAGLVTALGWWREIGLTVPRAWRNAHLLWYPLLLSLLPLAGGVHLPAPGVLGFALTTTVVGATMEELTSRGLLFRALLPSGRVRAVVVTSVLFASLHFVTLLLGAPLEAAVVTVIGALCGGLTYGALRLRTNSLWLPLIAHVAYNLIGKISTPEAVPYLLPVLDGGVLGLLVYGAFLLRPRALERDASIHAANPSDAQRRTGFGGGRRRRVERRSTTDTAVVRERRPNDAPPQASRGR